MNTTPDEKSGGESYAPIPAFVKRILALTGGTGVLAYGAGFVVVSMYLLSLGITELQLARARYITVGSLFWFMFVATVAPVFTAFWSAISQIELWFEHKAEFPLDKYLFIQSVIFIPCWGLLFGVGGGMVVFVMGSSSGNPMAAWIELSRHGHAYWSEFLSLAKGWFVPLYLLAILSSLILKVLDMTQRLQDFRTRHLIFIPMAGQNRTNESERSVAFHWARIVFIPTFGMVLLLILPYIGLTVLYTYSTSIYPRMNPSIGGGKFPAVQLVTDNQAGEIMSNILPMESVKEGKAFRTKSLRLLEVSERHYVVLTPPDLSGQAHLVDKALVRGIVPAAKK